MNRPFVRLVFAAVAIYATAAAALAWTHSHFLRDDFAGFFIAAHQPLFAAMMTPIDVHFVPLHRLVNHAIYAVAPMNFAVALALLLAVHAVTLGLLYALLQRLKDTPTNAVLLFFYGTNVQLGVLFVWWTSGLHRLPYIALAVATLYHFVVWRTERRDRSLVWAGLCFVGALGFFSKAALIPFTLLGLEIALARDTERRDRLRNLRAIAVFVAVAALQVWLARGLVDSRFSALHFDPAFLLAFEARSFAVLSEAIFAFGYLPAALPVNLVFWAFWAGFIGFTIARCRWNAVVWGVGIALVAMQFAVIGVSHRTAAYGLAMAGTDRYYFELMHLVVLFVALVLQRMPQRAPVESAAPRRRGRLRVALAATALLAMAALSFARFGFTIESARYQRHQDARIFAHNLSRGLRGLRKLPPGQAGLVDGFAPVPLTGKTAAHIRRHSDLLPLYDPSVRFDAAAPRRFRVGEDGSLREVRPR